MRLFAAFRLNAVYIGPLAGTWSGFGRQRPAWVGGHPAAVKGEGFQTPGMAAPRRPAPKAWAPQAAAMPPAVPRPVVRPFQTFVCVATIAGH